ncbi:hypothetical protein HWV62_33268 [Athelia sp. TMB]|nr:hypothetical protein HWV62_33268 [Athelia sp. TMB]
MASRSSTSPQNMGATHRATVVNPDRMGCVIPDIAKCRVIWPNREAMRKHILSKVDEAYDVLMARHTQTYLHYIRIATKDTKVPPEVLSEALGTAIYARDLLLEGVMARKYFSYMFFDLQKSEDNGDMYTMRVASAGATLLDDHDEFELNHRTYKSAFPALLRSMPNHASTYQHDSPSNLSNDLSNMQLGSSTSSSRMVWVG